MAIAAIHDVRLNHGVIGVERPWLDETKRRRSGVVIEQEKSKGKLSRRPRFEKPRRVVRTRLRGCDARARK
jgi:hypothetical protein